MFERFCGQCDQAELIGKSAAAFCRSAGPCRTRGAGAHDALAMTADAAGGDRRSGCGLCQPMFTVGLFEVTRVAVRGPERSR